MTAVILMKVLESSPNRYDRGIRLLTLGKLDAVYDRLVAPIQPGMLVLDIGCGTGALSLRAASRGALVKGMDINPAMLEIARQRAADAGLDEEITLVEMGVAELDGESSEGFDAVLSGLCFSELSREELSFTLGQIQRILKPGGLLLVADEVRPAAFFRRIPACCFSAAVGCFDLAADADHYPCRSRPARNDHCCWIGIGLCRIQCASQPDPPDGPQTWTGEFQMNFMYRLWINITETLLRFFPFPVKTGLREIGHPDRTSPVLVTGNFGLTVLRVQRALQGLDCYLLVANSRGINVWCAASGGHFSSS